MKLVSGISVLLLGGLSGCYAMTSNDEDCTQGRGRCLDDIVQHCVAGRWEDIEDCFDDDGVCALGTFGARCIPVEENCPNRESGEGADPEADGDARGSLPPRIPPETRDDVSALVPSSVFRDMFNDATLFAEIAYPNGDPHRCTNPNGVSFSNDGERHAVSLACYDEAVLEVDLDLPFGDYQISVAWATGADPHSWEQCNRAGFHGAFGASCVTPNRIILVNGELIHETAGRLVHADETTTLTYTGEINSLTLGAASAGSSERFQTYYDAVEIVRR